MDTGQGKFERVEADDLLAKQNLNLAMEALEAKYPEHGGWFQEGEIVELKGSRFRVKRIKPTEITLKLLKRSDR